VVRVTPYLEFENSMNDTNIATAFAAFDELLNRIGSPVGPVEGHGLLCGLFCVAREEVLPLWSDNWLEMGI